MTKKLTEYKKKRNFNKTSEPNPDKAATTSAKKLKFVVQHHDASHNHYDFRLEWEGVLLSWAVPKGPSFNPGTKRLAVHVENHPLAYGNFEGTIPKGQYGGGTVMLWDKGFWQPLEEDVNAALSEGSLKFVLKGKRLKGKWALVHMKGTEKDNNWLLLKDKDNYAQPKDGISQFITSIKTGRTMAQIENNEKTK